MLIRPRSGAAGTAKRAAKQAIVQLRPGMARTIASFCELDDLIHMHSPEAEENDFGQVTSACYQ